jgi:hypothetical protein
MGCMHNKQVSSYVILKQTNRHIYRVPRIPRIPVTLGLQTRDAILSKVSENITASKN